MTPDHEVFHTPSVGNCRDVFISTDRSLVLKMDTGRNNGDAVYTQTRNESRLLKSVQGTPFACLFPKLVASGETEDGRAWLITEYVDTVKPASPNYHSNYDEVIPLERTEKLMRWVQGRYGLWDVAGHYGNWAFRRDGRPVILDAGV